MNSDDLGFSTNGHLANLASDLIAPTRHPDLSFPDGNLALLCPPFYFIVHQGLLCRHSEVFTCLAQNIGDDGDDSLLDGRSVMKLDDAADDMICLLRALYDGVSGPTIEGCDFITISKLLRLSTKYRIDHLRRQILEALAAIWPSALPLWEIREKKATNSAGLYAPRPTFPHPILIINLARETDVPELLPSAYYDLSRYLPSQAVTGHSLPQDSTLHELSQQDLLNTLRGRECAARFLSTFVVNHLEGRQASKWCLYRLEQKPSRKRACKIAFEAITFEVLRDVNGVVCNRNSDPLYAIADTHSMQTRDDLPGSDNTGPFRACEACRLDYGAVVEAAREDFWKKLPEWFAVSVPNWS
ncbi:hypothetical protein JAAARDRAFT_177839 [Jaapia argillacea MUCL 33604]|uniref:BTB domain-containing protein n=1 Tax=Jaapia argillacea MUCL 33604 TaxID=933084 RepID=A0A067PRY7_9AGAM|nr:hypothetical protein JAAARDRAFT_177839 [Jaapia argillacea MUCL 33604]